MDKTTRHNLEFALEKLDIFLDPDNPKCAVPAEVRERARIYLDTWVAAPLHDILDHTEDPTKTRYDWVTGRTVFSR